MAKKLTSSKAREILHDKSVHGHPLTDKQRRFFGAIAGGAKPYKAEEGGWLDKYEQGGLMLKQKTKDNYGEKPNVNNDKATYPDGFVGWEYDITGRNYSPAWGGQFQMGGKLTFLEPTSRKLPAGYNPITGGSSTEYAVSIGGEDGEPAYLIPSFKYGKLLKDPVDEFRKTGEHLGGPFKTYQEADEWERTVRHPYVEKGQTIPTPLRRWGKDFAMGGSLPGAVGFTYARTQGAAPDNGPYAKKTKASAQNGMEMKYYQAGLDFKPKTISQDGTVIDPDGYWNPDNWGNPVIIPSTDITMEGVDQPLIGVSDTGDTQYMQPGEDYQFDGDYVTEYPVAQNGKTLFVDNPNDPRLKAYQDSLAAYNLSQRFLKGSASSTDYKRYAIASSEPDKDKYWGYVNKVVRKEPVVTEFNKYKGISPINVEPGSGGNVGKEFYPIFKKPKQPVKYKKPEPKQELPVKKPEPPVQKKQNIYEGTPVYSPGAGSGLPSALIGFLNKKGDITFIKPEDYERFAVPKYGREYIEKQRDGGVNKADEYPIEKLDQLLNFTNYNKPTKGGWLDKYN
jgi:hypothetical protein